MWRDLDEILRGAARRSRLVSAIDDCSVVLYFGTRRSCSSQYATTELSVASDPRKPIVAVFIEDVTLPARSDRHRGTHALRMARRSRRWSASSSRRAGMAGR